MGSPAPVDLLKEYTVEERLKEGVTNEKLAELLTTKYSAEERVALGITDQMIADLTAAKSEVTAAPVAKAPTVPVVEAASVAALVPAVAA